MSYTSGFLPVVLYVADVIVGFGLSHTFVVSGRTFVRPRLFHVRYKITTAITIITI